MTEFAFSLEWEKLGNEGSEATLVTERARVFGGWLVRVGTNPAAMALTFVADGEGRWRVKAITPIEQFNDYFKSNLEDQYCETIGGLVTDRFEHVPHTGETIEENGFRFRILGGDDRQARLLSVERIK